LPTVTPSPTPEPTATPSPTPIPTATPTIEPTPTPTATPGVIKLEKKEGAAKEEKLPKPTVKRPEELAAEKAKK
jgi:hypothetical protein